MNDVCAGCTNTASLLSLPSTGKLRFGISMKNICFNDSESTLNLSHLTKATLLPYSPLCNFEIIINEYVFFEKQCCMPVTTNKELKSTSCEINFDGPFGR